MKYVKNMIWCVVLLWVSTGLFNSLVDIWLEGGWWRLGFWSFMVLWVAIWVGGMMVVYKMIKDKPKEAN